MVSRTRVYMRPHENNFNTYSQYSNVPLVLLLWIFEKFHRLFVTRLTCLQSLCVYFFIEMSSLYDDTDSLLSLQKEKKELRYITQSTSFSLASKLFSLRHCRIHVSRNNIGAFAKTVDLPMNASVASPTSEMSNIYNNSVVRFWQHVFHDIADPRTRDWFLMSSPVPGASIMFGYLYFVLSWGPRHMEHRKPYKLKNTLILYNLLQVILSVWLFYEGLDAAWLTKYSWKCEPVDYSNSTEALRVARGVYMYFLAKISELLDTVFFVLRKKERQITFLHMYHHTVMPLISWGATKYYPGGHGTFIGVINSFVHIVMYTYYLLAAALPQYQQYLWWKKYITTLQMGQFCLAFIHSFQLLIYDCEYPRWSLVLILPNVMFFYFLFSDFYNKAYVSEEDKLMAKQLKKDNKAKKENGTEKQNGMTNGHADVSKKLTNLKMQNGKDKKA